MTSIGCVTMNGGLSGETITRKQQRARRPAASTAVQWTVLVPTGKQVPEAGAQLICSIPGWFGQQRSVKLGRGNLTTAQFAPAGRQTKMSGRQRQDSSWSTA